MGWGIEKGLHTEFPKILIERGRKAMLCYAMLAVSGAQSPRPKLKTCLPLFHDWIYTVPEHALTGAFSRELGLSRIM